MSFDCVICGTKVDADAGLEEGEILECENCGVELEIQSREPIVVGVFEEEEK